MGERGVTVEHIIGLQVENVKRVVAVKIEVSPEGGLVILSGDNGAGKSSILDAIEMALRGGDVIPAQPIRNGQKTARVIVKTESWVITRRFTEKGSYLDVTTADGLAPKSPQALLNELVTTVGFDPQAFAKMDQKEQAATLLRLFPVPLDLKKNAADAKAAFDERTLVNRDAKQLEARVLAIPFDAAIQPFEVDVSALTAKLSEIDAGAQRRLEATGRLDSAKREEASARCAVEEAEKQLAAMKRELAEATAHREACSRILVGLESVEDRVPVVEAINAAAGVNARVRQQKERKALTAQLDAKRAEADRLTAAIYARARERQEALAAASFPVPGLTIGDTGEVLFNGLPIEQCASSEQIRIGVALAAAANPKLKVCFVRDGSLLDGKTRAVLAELAKEHNLQVWMECVGDVPGSIHIVDGGVAEKGE
jgi:hypothetical protein